MQATIYRVEDGRGEGLYSPASPILASVPQSTGSADSNHPGPSSDIGLVGGGLGQFRRDHPGSMRYGFSSIDQAASWVNSREWREALTTAGFAVSVYQVENAYILGNTQAVFDIGNAEYVRGFTLLALPEKGDE